MKWVVLLLSVLVAVEGGMLMYSFQSGHPPFVEQEELSVEPPEEVVEENPSPEPTGLLANQQIGMIAELSDSLQQERQKLMADQQQLEKREKNLKELHSAYLQVRQVVEGLQKELETQLIKADETQEDNFKVLADVYAKMEPSSAARALQQMDVERAVLILVRMDSRALAAVMDSAVSSSVDGSKAVAQWSDAIRRLSELNGKVQ